MTAKAIFSDAQGRVYLLCPFCNMNTLKPANQFSVHAVTKIDCSCGNSYEVMLEYRKAYRKKTSLSGIYWKTISPEASQHATIRDLDLDGCCLSVPDNHGLKQGEYISMIFRLKNAERTKIERQAMVRWIDKNYIGCQFLNKPPYSPELGYYLQDSEASK